jgi:hypothetical protein
MSKGQVRLAKADEYYCWGCRTFHRFEDRPRSPKNKKRGYCVESYERIARMIKERKL